MYHSLFFITKIFSGDTVIEVSVLIGEVLDKGFIGRKCEQARGY